MYVNQIMWELDEANLQNTRIKAHEITNIPRSFVQNQNKHAMFQLFRLRECRTAGAVAVYQLNQIHFFKCFGRFCFFTLMINIMTAGLWEQEINVTQSWPGILN